MSSLNKVILIGNVGKDPELKHTPSGVAVSTFSVATSEKWKDAEGNQQEKTEWHSIVAWKKTAEICAEYLRKGAKVCIEGKLQTQKWEKDGVTHYRTEINASNVVMLGKKEQQEGTPTAPEKNEDYTTGPKDDDLPF